MGKKTIAEYYNANPDELENFLRVVDEEGDKLIARVAELEAAILNIGQKIDRETYANVKAAILGAVKIAKGN